MLLGPFYKWEDHNHGPRAKKTCFGVHEEVCQSYHKTLHFVGASHKCAACSNTTKAHARRHQEIARIVRDIHELEGRSTIHVPLCKGKRKGEKKDDPILDPSNDGSVRHDTPDQEPEIKWDSGSSTLNDEADEAKERQRCWSGAMESADARRAAKAERKAAKNQVLFDVPTQDELTTIEQVLHPCLENQASTLLERQGLANNPTIDENVAFNANTFKWSKLRQGVHAKKMAKSNSSKQKHNTPQQDSETLGPIFAQLGINTDTSKASRQRKSLDAKLRVAILGDLVAFENDQVEMMQRMAGYWRYANKRVYNEMVRNNQLWDWATGEKLPEIREDAELDNIREEGDAPDIGTKSAEAERRVPEDWDDPAFESPAGEAVPSLDLPIDGSYTDGKVCRSNTVGDEQSFAVGATKLDDDDQVNLANPNMGIETLPAAFGDEVRERLRTESEAELKEDAETLQGGSTAKSLHSPLTIDLRHETGFQGVKDTRVFGKAINEAPPPPGKNPPRRSPTSSQSLFSPSAIQDRDLPDPLNRFGALDREVPAPCEEGVKKGPISTKTIIKIPAKPIVKTLVIHDEQDDWTTMRKAKGKKNVKGSAAVVPRGKQTAVVVGNVSRGKRSAAVVKRGT